MEEVVIDFLSLVENSLLQHGHQMCKAPFACAITVNKTSGISFTVDALARTFIAWIFVFRTVHL